MRHIIFCVKTRLSNSQYTQVYEVLADAKYPLGIACINYSVWNFKKIPWRKLAETLWVPDKYVGPNNKVYNNFNCDENKGNFSYQVIRKEKSCIFKLFTKVTR